MILGRDMHLQLTANSLYAITARLIFSEALKFYHNRSLHISNYYVLGIYRNDHFYIQAYMESLT